MNHISRSRWIMIFILILLFTAVACGSGTTPTPVINPLETTATPFATLVVPIPTLPVASGAALIVSTTSARPGEAVGLNGTGFPVNTPVAIGVGPAAAPYTLIASAQSGGDGRFATQLSVPGEAQPGQQWVFVAEVGGAAVSSGPISIVAAEVANQPGDSVNQPVNGLVNRTNIFLIALEDAGQSGPLIGCNDSVVPVPIDIEATDAPLAAAINRLISLNEQYYGQSGLYNALYQSNLALQGVNITNREAIISLTGSLQLSGVCDDPRVLAQLERTALQYDTVDTVSIFLNGESLPSQIAGRG